MDGQMKDDLVEIGCEVRGHGGWQWVSLSDALRLYSSRMKRCQECHGQVRVDKPRPGMAAQLVHYERNSGCSLGDCFDGRRRLHQKPMR